MSISFDGKRFPKSTSTYFGEGPKMSFYLEGTASVLNGKGILTNVKVTGHAGPNNTYSSESRYGYPVTVGLTIGGQYKEVTRKFNTEGTWYGTTDREWNLGTISNIDLSGLVINDSTATLTAQLYVRRWGSATGGGSTDANNTFTRTDIPMEIEALDMGAPTITGAPYYGVLGSNANITLTPGTAGRTATGSNYVPDSWKWQTCDVGSTIWSTSETASTSNTQFPIAPSYIANQQPFQVRVQGYNSVYSTASDWSAPYSIVPNSLPVINDVVVTPSTFIPGDSVSFSFNFNYNDSDTNQSFTYTVAQGTNDPWISTSNPVSVNLATTSSDNIFNFTCSVNDGYDTVSTTKVVAAVQDFTYSVATAPVFTHYQAKNEDSKYSRAFSAAVFGIGSNGLVNPVSCDVLIDRYVNGSLSGSYVAATTTATIPGDTDGTITSASLSDIDSIAVTHFNYDYSADFIYKVRFKIYNALYAHEVTYPSSGYLYLASSPVISEIYNDHANSYVDSGTHKYGRRFRIAFANEDASLDSGTAALTTTDAIMVLTDNGITTSQFITSLNLEWHGGENPYIDGTISGDLLFGGTITFKTSIPLANGASARKPISITSANEMVICNGMTISSDINLLVNGINLTGFNIYSPNDTANSTWLYCQWMSLFPSYDTILEAQDAYSLPDDFLQLEIQGISDSAKYAKYTIEPTKDNDSGEFRGYTTQAELATAIKNGVAGTNFSGNQAFTITPSIINIYGVEFPFVTRYNALINHNDAPNIVEHSFELTSQKYYDQDDSSVTYTAAWASGSKLLNNTDLTFELYYNSRSSGLMTITLEYSDDNSTWYLYGSTTLIVSGGYNAANTRAQNLKILNEDTAHLLFDSTAGITLRAKATLNSLTGDTDSIPSLNMVALPKPVLNNLTLINDLDTGTILTGEIYPSTIDDNNDVFNLYQVGDDPEATNPPTPVAEYDRKVNDEYLFTLGSGLSGTVNCFAYYKVSKVASFDGHTVNMYSSTSSTPMLLYTIVPTVIHRQNGVGINVSNLAATTVFQAKSKDSRINLLLSGTNHTVTLNLETGEITGLVLGSQSIDGGTWS